MRLVIGYGFAALVLASVAAPAFAEPVARVGGTAATQPAGTDAALADQSATANIDTPPIDETGLARVLQYQPPLSPGNGPTATLRIPRDTPKPADWSRNDRPDGSAKVSVSKPLAGPWDVAIGGDVSLPPDQTTTFGPGQSLPGTSRTAIGKAGAWAKVNVPDVAGVELRVDPSLDGSTVGADLRRTVPFGANYSVTLNNRISVTEPFGAPGPSPSAGATTQIWNSERTVRFNILSTGTSFGVSAASSTLTSETHHSLSAQQRIYGPLQVTTTITDPGRPNGNQSVTARFRLNW